MAKRPIFIPNLKGFPFVKESLIEFRWHPGFAKVQAQKSIVSLHEAAAEAKIAPVLEISSKSHEEVGVSLSAFNLKMIKNQRSLSVECAYQGSKVFANGGPFSELYYVSSKEAKTDERLRTSGDFTGYEFFGENFLINPVTAFYDWLYLTALSQNPSLANKLFDFKGFSDIAFNPKKSLNTQARAAALFVSLCHNDEIDRVVEDKNYYIDLITNNNLNDVLSMKTQKKGNNSEEQYLQPELPF
ncbi:MAG: hypothetical protein WBF90_31605 [Rivularia sp. (in: cyanobacteria)]|jgi:hypothetical protein